MTCSCADVALDWRVSPRGVLYMYSQYFLCIPCTSKPEQPPRARVGGRLAGWGDDWLGGGTTGWVGGRLAGWGDDWPIPLEVAIQGAPEAQAGTLEAKPARVPAAQAATVWAKQ